MKKLFLWIVAGCLILGALFFIEVPTKQRIGYQINTYRIPLYIKIIEFVDRDYRYRRIVKQIVREGSSDEEKVRSIFDWCVKNIQHQPKDLPIVDDHQLNIIIRGYGIDEQCEDIFTLLCTYSGLEAFYDRFAAPVGQEYPVSFVRLRDKWYPFSVYYRIPAFRDGAFISVGDLLGDPAAMASFLSGIPNSDIGTFKAQLARMEFKASSIRVKGQSPAGRITQTVKNLLGL